MTSGPFFIVGSERSGTTMLRLMLNEHSRLHLPTESHFIADLLQTYSPEHVLDRKEVEKALEMIINLRRWKDWGDNCEELRAQFFFKEKLTLRELIEIVFQHNLSKCGKPRWGDKTPNYIYRIDTIKQLFPEAKFIHIIRDGRDVCVSMLKTEWFGRSIRQIASKWQASLLAGEKAKHQIPADDYLEIKYEEVVLNTEEILQEITGFIGEKYEHEMLDFYKHANEHLAEHSKKFHSKTLKKPEQSDTEKWKQILTWQQIAIYEALAGNQLKQYGYKLHFNGLMKIVPLTFGFLFYLAELTLPIRRKLGVHFPTISKNY